MKVILSIKRVVDTIDERVLEFTLTDAETGERLYATKSSEKRNGVRHWDQLGIYSARGRVRSWLKRNSASLVDSEPQ